MKLSPRQHGLQHISRIQRTVRLARAYNGMQFIDKQNDLPVRFFHILQHRLQTFFKLAPVLGACHQRSHIQRKDLLIFQPLRHIASDNTLRQPFHHRGLPDAGFPDQNRIVFALSGQNPDHVPDLVVSPDHRIKLLLSCPLHQFLSVFFQCIIGRLRIIAGHTLIAADRGKRLQKTLPCNAELPENLLNLFIRLFDHHQKQMFHGNILVSHLFCLILRGNQYLI